MSAYCIGVDLGGTNLRIAAIDTEGRLLEKITTGTQVARGRDQVISEMCDAIRQLAVKFPGRLLGTGIGVPGIIEIETGTVRGSPNLPDWADCPVRAEIERRLDSHDDAIARIITISRIDQLVLILVIADMVLKPGS